MSTETPHRHRGAWWRLLASEMTLMLGRRRNQIGLVILAAVPIIIAVALRGDSGSTGMVGGLTNGLVVPLVALVVESAFFLPLAVSMLSGDAISGEANQGTLRYVLTVPVARTRLLLAKFVSLMLGALIGVGLIMVVGAVAGVAALGAGPSATLSGTQISFGQTLLRLLMVAGYLTVMMWAVAAIGIFFSTLIGQPMAVTVAVMVVVVLMLISQNFTQLDWLHPWTITHWIPNAVDLMRDPPYWSNVARGAGLAAGYIVVFGSAAWAHFNNKDVTS